MTIRFVVISVARRISSAFRTIRYKYEGENCKGEHIAEAEWEEVEFTTEYEEKPVIQVANVSGNASLGGTCKLVINNPDLFGTYKVGDIIEFTPTRLLEAKASEN
jgi:hypothetical protein